LLLHIAASHCCFTLLPIRRSGWTPIVTHHRNFEFLPIQNSILPVLLLELPDSRWQ
jgi:hypothetical protein